jgi:hypothetical protein
MLNDVKGDYIMSKAELGSGSSETMVGARGSVAVIATAATLTGLLFGTAACGSNGNQRPVDVSSPTTEQTVEPTVTPADGEQPNVGDVEQPDNNTGEVGNYTLNLTLPDELEQYREEISKLVNATYDYELEAIGVDNIQFNTIIDEHKGGYRTFLVKGIKTNTGEAISGACLVAVSYGDGTVKVSD